MKIIFDFWRIFDVFWRPKWMIWGAKMPLKIIQKINEILDAFLSSFWKQNPEKWVGGVSPHGAWNSEIAY